MDKTRSAPGASGVDELTGGKLPPAWLMAEGICLVEAGRKKEALLVLEGALRHSPPGPNSFAGKRLAKVREDALR